MGVPMSFAAPRSVARLSLIAVFASALFALAACGTPRINYQDASVDVLYDSALADLKDGQYTVAAQKFAEVERQHPYSVWARRAMLMSAYANYLGNNYSDAILAADRFIGLHPGNKDVPYAYYLKAICYYEQITDVARDQKMTEDALGALEELVRRFPTTEYARDARLKIDMTNDHLAGRELAIGRYYERRREYVAAINRFRNVVVNYQTTSQVPEALHRLTEAYLALGVKKEAQTAAAVLGYNFPGNEWYQDSYDLLKGQNLQPAEDKGSWISKAWHAVF
jgi:outer membrane protein assembly factor BamD